MLNNKEVLEKFEEIMLEISERNSNTGDYENYANEIEALIDNVANKTDLYKELIRLWLNEEIELKEKDLKKIDDYLNIIRNKKNCVNLSTAIAKRYFHIKFDLDDEFTNDFVRNIRDNSIESEAEYYEDNEDSRVVRISIGIHNDNPTSVRDILFIMSYLHIEEEYDDILKKLMVYEVKQD